MAHAFIFWAAFLSHTWCESMCAPDPRGSFVIRVHVRGIPSCQGGTLVYGAFLLIGSYRTSACRMSLAAASASLVWPSASWSPGTARPMEWRSLCLLTTSGGVPLASTRHKRLLVAARKHLSLQVSCDNCWHKLSTNPDLHVGAHVVDISIFHTEACFPSATSSLTQAVYYVF